AAAGDNQNPRRKRPGVEPGLRQAARLLARVSRERLVALSRQRSAKDRAKGRAKGREEAGEFDDDRLARALAQYARTLSIARALLGNEAASGASAQGEAGDG